VAGSLGRALRRFGPLRFDSADNAAAAVRSVRDACTPGHAAAAAAAVGTGSLAPGREDLSQWRTPGVICVVNPAAGRGRGRQEMEETVRPMLRAAGVPWMELATGGSLDAARIVAQLPLGGHVAKVRAIAVVGGDGTLHEVLQGLMQRPDWDAVRLVPLAMVGSGTGNAAAVNVGIAGTVAGTLAVIKGASTPLDVFSCHALRASPSGARFELLRYGLLSLTACMIARTDLGTDHLRWMGDARFTLGILQDIAGNRRYPLDVFTYSGGGGGRGEGRPSRAAPAGPRDLSVDVQALAESFCLGEPPLFRELLGGDGEGHVELEASGLRDVGRVLAAALEGAEGVEGAEGWQRVSQGTFGMWGVYNMPWISRDCLICPGQAPGSGELKATWLAEDATLGEKLGALLASEGQEGGELLARHRAYREATCRGVLVMPRRGGPRHWMSLDGEEIAPCPLYLETHPGLCRIVVAGDREGDRGGVAFA